MVTSGGGGGLLSPGCDGRGQSGGGRQLFSPAVSVSEGSGVRDSTHGTTPWSSHQVSLVITSLHHTISQARLRVLLLVGGGVGGGGVMEETGGGGGGEGERAALRIVFSSNSATGDCHYSSQSWASLQSDMKQHSAPPYLLS